MSRSVHRRHSQRENRPDDQASSMFLLIAATPRHSTVQQKKGEIWLPMCDDFIHQGLTHDPTVSRRAFGVAMGATIALQSAGAATPAKVTQKDVNVTMA